MPEPPEPPATETDQQLVDLYSELRRVARRLLVTERTGQSLAATDLAHEAWLRLAGDGGLAQLPGDEFRRRATLVMRHVLVDRARARGAQKRGGRLARISLEALDLAATGSFDALRAASFVPDEAAMRSADSALLHHFPASHAAREARAVAFVDRDPARAIPAIEALLAGAATPRPFQRYNLGLAHERLGHLADAEREYRAAVAAEPGFARAWNNLGMLLRKRKDHAGAAAAFRAAVAAAPRHGKAWNNLGITLRALGDTQGARAALEQAIALEPGYAVAHYNLGNLLLAAKDPAAAIEQFRCAVAADPGYVLAQTNLGDALERSGRPQEALLAFARAADLAPRELIPNYDLARTALDLGLRELALAAATHTTEIAPGRAEPWAVLAEALLVADPVDAPRALAAARTADDRAAGRDPEVRVLVARALLATGDREGALAVVDALARSAEVQANEALRTTVEALRAKASAAR